jgi:hypothetical protein
LIEVVAGNSSSNGPRIDPDCLDMESDGKSIRIDCRGSWVGLNEDYEVC